MTLPVEFDLGVTARLPASGRLAPRVESSAL